MKKFFFVFLVFCINNSSAQFITLSPFKISFGRTSKVYCYKLDSISHCTYMIDSLKQKNKICAEGYTITKPVIPHYPEICNGIDDDCNGMIDDGLPMITYWADGDNDGAGDPNNPKAACSQPSGFVTNSNDCNDLDKTVITPLPYYTDGDGDGYGSALVYICSSTVPLGYAIQNGDCNDQSPTTFPDAWEIYNGIDDNCNGEIDEDCTNPLINGSCDELTQWTRDYKDMSMFSEPFNTNYSKFHTTFGTFTNGMAFTHYIADGMGSGWNWSGCNPWGINPAVKCGDSKCEADELGCSAHAFDYYSECMAWYAIHNVSAIINTNPYINYWGTQRKYLDIPLSAGVKVIGTIMGTELSSGTSYANSFYFPQGTSQYVRVWMNYRDSVKRNYPDIPVGIWIGNIWDTRSVMYQYNNAIKEAADSADFIAAYGQNKNVVGLRLIHMGAWTEQDAIDTVLAFSYWFPKWIAKVTERFGDKPIVMLTNGTDPITEDWLQKTFLAPLQTEYQIFVEQMDSSNRIEAGQEYRTREFNNQALNAATDIINLIHFKRGIIYSTPTHKAWEVTNNPYIVGVRYTTEDGHGWIEVLNFSDKDWNAPMGTVEGWSGGMLLPYKQAQYYSATYVKSKSIGFVSF